MFRRKKHERIEEALISLYRMENERLVNAIIEKDIITQILAKELKEKEGYIDELSNNIRNDIIICTNCSDNSRNCSKL